MLRFIMRQVGGFVRWLFWDVDRRWQRRSDKVFPKTDGQMGSNMAQKITMGKAVAQIYLNRTAYGKPYFKVTFRSIGKDGRPSNSFHVMHLQDLEDCITRVRAWITDSRIAA